MSIAMVVRAKKMAADLREKHEKVRKPTLCSASLKMTAITRGRERREKVRSDRFGGETLFNF